MMSRRKRADKEPEVKWAVTDQVLGDPLTIARLITLHHFLPLSSDAALMQQRLEAYTPPTEKEPWWVVRALGGETWRLQLRSGRLGFFYEIWWGFEWRRRQKPPAWVACLGWSIEYGKRKKWGEDGVEIEEPTALPERDDEQQSTMF
jgi:hypothetical protein